MIWRIFVVGVLIIVVAVSVINREQRPERDEASAPAAPLQPGYYIDDARITETGADGAPLYRVEAARIQQDPTDNGIRMEQLTLTYSTPQDRSWTLTAARGFVPPGSKTLNLAGNVRIVGQPVPDMLAAVVYTERLTIDTETNVAATRDRVDIEWGTRRLSTMGLVADLKAERLRLESAVHGRFPPIRR